MVLQECSGAADDPVMLAANRRWAQAVAVVRFTERHPLWCKADSDRRARCRAGPALAVTARSGLRSVRRARRALRWEAVDAGCRPLDRHGACDLRIERR